MPKKVCCNDCPLLADHGIGYECGGWFTVRILRDSQTGLGEVVSDNCELVIVNFESKVFTPRLREE